MQLTIQFAELFSSPVFAAIALPDGIAKIINMLKMVSFLLAVAMLIVASIMFSLGKVESAIFGATAAGVLALATSIVHFAFTAAGDDPGIPV